MKEVVGEVGSPAARPAVGGGGGSGCPKPYPSLRCAPASPRRKASSATTKPPPPLGSTAARCSRSSDTPCFEKRGAVRPQTRLAPKHSGEAHPHCRVNWVSMSYPQVVHTFQTKQVVFTRRDAAQPTSKNSEACAKRERRHAPHASHRAQARRTRPSSSLPGPKQCSGNAPRAQVKVNSTGAPGGRLDEESRDHIPLGHLERVQFSLQWVCNEVCQARAHER